MATPVPSQSAIWRLRWQCLAVETRLTCSGLGLQACHPGIASTDIYNKMDTSGKLTAKVYSFLNCDSSIVVAFRVWGYE